MSEDKMKADFDRWIFDPSSEGYPLRHTNAAWYAWKACAAIKDAEIAEHKKNSHYFQDQYVKQRAEIAARDLMIKELREDVERIAFMGMDKPMQADGEYFYQSQLRNCIAIAAQALAKSEHHNSRALEKMLLEAEIKGMRNSSIESQREANKKLAELNKE
ncbi:MAG TPA: hypothetical protein VIY48_21365 [Candidatus Paceibacterota bacterium]